MSALLQGSRSMTAVAGLTFVALVVIAVAVGSAPEANSSNSEILDYYTDSGNQTKQMIAAIVLVAAVCAFVAFGAGLRQVFLEAGVASLLSDLVLVGTAISATLALAGWAVGTAVPATFVFSDSSSMRTLRASS